MEVNQSKGACSEKSEKYARQCKANCWEVVHICTIGTPELNCVWAWGLWVCDPAWDCGCENHLCCTAVVAYSRFAVLYVVLESTFCL